MHSVSIGAPPALRDDIRCILTIGVCSTINLLAGFNALLFNLGLMYGALGLFVARFVHRRLVERKSPAIGMYPVIMGIVLPLITIAILFLIRGEATNFCVGMFLSVAFYNALYLGMSRRSR